MKRSLIFLTIAALLSPCLVMAQRRERQTKATQSGGLTVDKVVALVRAGFSSEEVVGFIQQKPSRFDMTVDMVNNLLNDDVPKAVVNAMLRSGSNTTEAQQGQLDARPQGEFDPPGREGFPSQPPQTQQPPQSQPPTQSQSPPQSQAADPGRLDQARNYRIPASWTPPTRQEPPPCAHNNAHQVEIDIEYGYASQPNLCDSGIYCFTVKRANPLYDWDITFQVTQPTGNPLELLKEAIQALTNLGTGAAPATAAPTTARVASTDPCPPTLQPILADVEVKAATLRERFAVMVPLKDASAKALSQTLREWTELRTAFDAFEEAVRSLQTQLQAPGAENCGADLRRKAEAIILDDYPKVRRNYEALGIRLSRPTVIYRELQVEPTSTVKVVTTPSYGDVPAKAQTFLFEPCFPILSASAGFLLTGLQARTYASATSPDPADPTKTQNQLRVDYGAGIRPALAALLTANIPHLNRKNYGLGVTAGLVFDVSNGKADTSRFGFFGGPSFRLTPWVFLTPGVHFGEFADFPQGFNRPGQVIPTGTGTPTPTKRYTAKFAFAITFKIRDLGAPSATTEAKK